MPARIPVAAELCLLDEGGTVTGTIPSIPLVENKCGGAGSAFMTSGGMDKPFAVGWLLFCCKI